MELLVIPVKYFLGVLCFMFCANGLHSLLFAKWGWRSQFLAACESNCENTADWFELWCSHGIIGISSVCFYMFRQKFAAKADQNLPIWSMVTAILDTSNPWHIWSELKLEVTDTKNDLMIDFMTNPMTNTHHLPQDRHHDWPLTRPIHSKSEKICGTAFSVKKNCGKSA